MREADVLFVSTCSCQTGPGSQGQELVREQEIVRSEEASQEGAEGSKVDPEKEGQGYEGQGSRGR